MNSRNSKVSPGVYRHYKGSYYLVSFVARHSETGEYLVCYLPLYEASGVSWSVRPLDMFQEEVEVEGKKVPRFEYVGEQRP